MNDSIPSFDDRPFRERVELRVTFHKVVEVFEACSKFKEADKELLLQEISKRLSEYLPQAPVEPPAPVNSDPSESFADRCLDLAATAPNDKIWSALLTIAQICAAEATSDENATHDPLSAAGSWPLNADDEPAQQTELEKPENSTVAGDAKSH